MIMSSRWRTTSETAGKTQAWMQETAMPVELTASTYVPRYHDLYKSAREEPSKTADLMRGGEYMATDSGVRNRFRETQEMAVKEEKRRMVLELNNHEDTMQRRHQNHPVSTEGCSALEREKPRVFSPLEDSRRLLERHDREIDLSRYNHRNHAMSRSAKFPSYKAAMESIRFDQFAADVKCREPRTSQFMFQDNKEPVRGREYQEFGRKSELMRGPYYIAPPRTDNRSMLRDTLLSMGEYGEERSNRAVYQYSGKYADQPVFDAVGTSPAMR